MRELPPISVRRHVGMHQNGSGGRIYRNALDQWASSKGIQQKLTQPGKPTQNTYIERFNRRLRDECLNEHWFMSLLYVLTELAVWQKDYNEARPYSSLDYQTPAAFAAGFCIGEQAGQEQKQEFLTDFTM